MDVDQLPWTKVRGRLTENYETDREKTRKTVNRHRRGKETRLGNIT